jgi:hypothetical protein
MSDRTRLQGRAGGRFGLLRGETGAEAGGEAERDEDSFHGDFS